MGRPPRKERERARHRREILRAAEKVFAEKGFHGATTEEIARQAEFAVGTLYKFFASKEEIYWAVLENGMHQRLEFVRKAFEDPQTDPVRVIERYIEGKAKFYVEHLTFFRLFFREYLGGSPVLTTAQQRRLWEIFEESLTCISSAIRRGIDTGRFAEVPPREAALALEGMTNIFLRSCLFKPDRGEYDANVPVIKRMFFEGLLKRKGAHQ